MPDDKPHRTSPRVYGGFALAAGVIFAADYVTPTGYAIWLAYLGLLFATIFVEDRRAPWLVAGLNTVLVFLRVLVNPSDVSPEVALVNRSLCVALLWMGSALLTSVRHVTAPIQMRTSDRLKSELLAIIVAVTGLACFSVLFLSQGDQSPFSEFLRQNVSGGMVPVLLLSVTAVGVVLARRVSDLSRFIPRLYGIKSKVKNGFASCRASSKKPARGRR